MSDFDVLNTGNLDRDFINRAAVRKLVKVGADYAETVLEESWDEVPEVGENDIEEVQALAAAHLRAAGDYDAILVTDDTEAGAYQTVDGQVGLLAENGDWYDANGSYGLAPGLLVPLVPKLEITDETLDRAARRIDPGAWEDYTRNVGAKKARRDRARATARAVLDAALGEEQS